VTAVEKPGELSGYPGWAILSQASNNLMKVQRLERNLVGPKRVRSAWHLVRDDDIVCSLW
jgi:hypothetical protein